MDGQHKNIMPVTNLYNGRTHKDMLRRKQQLVLFLCLIQNKSPETNGKRIFLKNNTNGEIPPSFCEKKLSINTLSRNAMGKCNQ